MDHPLRLDRFDDVRPWRMAVLALAAVAAVELVLLVIAGGVLLVKPGEHVAVRSGEKPASVKAAAAQPKPDRPTGTTASPAGAAIELPRTKVGLLVLNGNGRQGAASAAAARAQRKGYRIEGVANAPPADYPRTIVMFRPGFAPEANRLARDLGARVVVPLDGMRPSQLHGAHAVLILGNT